MTLTEGLLAPAFEAVDQNEKRHSLKGYKGQWLLLYFYPKDNTPGCTKEACYFRDYFEDLKEKVQILGVSHDRVESHLKFASKHHLPFPLLSDPSRKIIKAYEADGFLFTKRISYLIDPRGRIAKIYRKVDPRRHAQEVLEDLKVIQSGQS